MVTTFRASFWAPPRQVQVNFRQGARPLHGLTRVIQVDPRFGLLVGGGDVGVDHRMTPWELQGRARVVVPSLSGGTERRAAVSTQQVT